MFRNRTFAQRRHTALGTSKCAKPAAPKLTPAESAALTAERHRLERENAKLREQVQQAANWPIVLGPSLSKFAAGIRFASRKAVSQ